MIACTDTQVEAIQPPSACSAQDLVVGCVYVLPGDRPRMASDALRHTVDGRNPAPKKPWNDDFLANTNKQRFFPWF